MSENNSEILTANFGIVFRGIAKVVEEIQSLHGETHISREADEKLVLQAKRIADSLERIEGAILITNEYLGDLSRRTENSEGHLAVIQTECSRIEYGLKNGVYEV